AVVCGVAQANPAMALPTRFITKVRTRTRVLTPDEIRIYLHTLYRSNIRRQFKLALHLILLTLVRKAELLLAQWKDVDLEVGEWKIPAENSKTDQPHTVYLSRQATKLFQELKTLAGGSVWVMPGRSGLSKPFSHNAMNQAMGGITFEIPPFTIHDLRRTGSTLLHEKGFSSDVIEKALNHQIKGVRGVYNRAEYAEQRRQMLQFWGDFVEALATEKEMLSTLAAEVILARVSAKYGLRVGVISILHTFNGELKFNSHVHTMVTGGGLHGSSDTWVSRVYYDRDALMEAWRKAVIELLRAALRAGQLRTKMSVDLMEEMLTQQEKRWWSIKIQSFENKWHFLQYAGRYVKRPPIPQRRITSIEERTVTFWFKDKRLRRKVEVQCSLEEFIDRWAQHIPERYQHAVRSFGLFAPRALRQTGQS